MRTNGILSPVCLCRIFVLCFLLLNSGCCLFCCGTNGWVMNRSGMKQYARGHYAQARHRFARAIAHDPCNPDYRHNLAMALQKQGDLAASERILRYNLTIDAMHQPTYHSLAQLLVTEGRGAEAQELVAGWVATQPYVPEANIEMAWIQRESGDFASAEQSLQNALRADPTHPVALAHLGQLYQGSGRADMAASYYQRSLASNWDQPEVQSRLATLTETNSMTRSAMMQNPPDVPMLAGNPGMPGDAMFVSNTTMIGDPMRAGTPMMPSLAMTTDAPFGSDPQAAALEDLKSNPKPRTKHRRHEREKDNVIATYPLPDFNAPLTSWKPATPGQPAMAYQTADIMEAPISVSQMSDNPYSTPRLNSGIPLADPAHFGPPRNDGGTSSRRSTLKMRWASAPQISRNEQSLWAKPETFRNSG